MQQSARILLVEDEEIIALMIEDLLVSSGFQVTIYTRGLEAWECLQTDSSSYDLVLLDRNLPDMNGLEFLNRIKGVATLAQIDELTYLSNGNTVIATVNLIRAGVSG